MKRLPLWTAIIIGFILTAIFVIIFYLPFWLLGVENIVDKWDKFMNSLIFNKK